MGFLSSSTLDSLETCKVCSGSNMMWGKRYTLPARGGIDSVLYQLRGRHVACGLAKFMECVILLTKAASITSRISLITDFITFSFIKYLGSM